MKPNISNSYTRNSYLLTVTWDQPSVTVTHGTVVHWQSHETEHEQQLHTEQLFIDNHMGPNICHSYTRNSFLLTITWDQTSVKLHTEQLFIDSHMVPTICKSYTGNSCLLTVAVTDVRSHVNVNKQLFSNGFMFTCVQTVSSSTIY
jgi:hypothetical protein